MLTSDIGNIGTFSDIGESAVKYPPMPMFYKRTKPKKRPLNELRDRPCARDYGKVPFFRDYGKVPFPNDGGRVLPALEKDLCYPPTIIEGSRSAEVVRVLRLHAIPEGSCPIANKGSIRSFTI